MPRKTAILMVLTHDRFECLRLCLDMLEHANAYRPFDHVVLLLQAVSPPFRRAVARYIAAHPAVPWDTIEGNGPRPLGISQIQNVCINRYPHSIYVKIDDDIFVPTGWAERLLETYHHFATRPDLALITTLIPNNAFGLHRLLTTFYPELLPEFESRFHAPPDPRPKSPTWQSPAIAQWATRRFIHLNAANLEQQQRLAASSQPRWYEFARYFSIGCICYDYAHIQRMGGALPPTEEPAWCAWIQQNHQTCILDQSLIVLHYSFFVQQDWLDRTPLLEDIRRINLPGTSPPFDRLRPALRFASQLPRILRRRFTVS